MKIKIYQVNTDRDDHRCAFMGLDWLKKATGADAPDSAIYDRVYAGEIHGSTLEDVYAKFNLDHPADYTGRSMSVSDIVEIESGADVVPGFYFCDTIGFKKVDFDASRALVKEDKITVVLLEPGKLARIEQIDASLEGLQKTVDGYIEAMYPFEEEVCVICNEEGKIHGMPLNRAIRIDGQIVDIIAGPCFICDCSGEDFGSLSPEQQNRYMRKFKYPEHIIKINGEIAAIPYNPSPKAKEANVR